MPWGLDCTTIIIPARPNSKDQGCAVQTIERLIIDGVDKNKIKIMFTETRKNTAVEFAQLISGMKENNLTPDLNFDNFSQHSFQ